MASWQRQLAVLIPLVVFSVGSRPGLAAPPASSDPSPELLAAIQVLDRLMGAASIEAPITLIVRPFRGPVCPPPAADPAILTEAAATKPPPSDSAVCLSGFKLPHRPQQGFFVPFVVSLQRQAHPESNPEQPSGVIEERTILLNATGLELVQQLAPPGKRQRREPAAVLPAAATCRIALEFAAVQLNQPRLRRESFDRIHTRLAERIKNMTGVAHKGWSFLELLAFNAVTFGYFIPYEIIGYLEGIPGQNRGDWINARLSESPHWRVLQRDAPEVATALKELHGLNETAVSQTWGQIDAWFGVAAQEREEVIEGQRNQAQVEALRLLAAAGIDPRSCADVFVPASAVQPDAAVLKTYEQARGKGLDSWPRLPRRFLPAEQKMVIFPKNSQLGHGSSAPAPKADP